MKYASTALLGIFLFALTTLSVSAAQLKFDRLEATIDLEPGQEEAKAVFNVTNEGAQSVRIARIKTSCGCTGSILDRKIIEPGESTEIVATFNKGKRRGSNTNRLEVFLDSEPDSVATLKMTVNIPELISAQPEIVYWNASATKSSRTVKIVLDKRYLQKISGVDFDASFLEVTKETDPDGRSDLILEIAPKSYSEQIRQTITVSGTGKEGLQAEARIHVFVQP